MNAWHFARYLISTGKSCTLLTFNRNLQRPRIERIDGVPVRRISYFNLNIATKILSYSFLILPVYFFQILKSEYVYIVGGNIIGYRSIILLSGLLRRKTIFRSSMLEFDDLQNLLERSPVLKPYMRALYRMIHTYISINPEFSESAIQSGFPREKILEMSQGVDINSFMPAGMELRSRLRVKYKVPEDKLVILSVGYLVSRKGYSELFQFLARLEEDFILLHVGESEYGKGHFMHSLREETHNLVELGNALLDQKILFFKPTVEIKELYQLADIFILNSKQEGTPNALLEAMSCGLSTLCRSLKGIEDNLIKDGLTGYNFSNFKSFHEGYISLASDPANRSRIGLHSRALVEKEHSMEKLSLSLFNHERSFDQA